MRRFIDICEQMDSDDEQGPLLRALDRWGAGWAGDEWGTSTLHAEMLRHRDAAREWSRPDDAPFLYRGICLAKTQMHALVRYGRFEIVTPADRPLASWSSTQQGAEDYMAGFASPWVIFRKPTASLNIFINYHEAYFDLRAERAPFDEIIVEMPHRMVVGQEDIVVSENFRNKAPT